MNRLLLALCVLIGGCGDGSDLPDCWLDSLPAPYSGFCKAEGSIQWTEVTIIEVNELVFPHTSPLP